MAVKSPKSQIARAIPFRTPELVVSETGRYVPEQQMFLHLVHVGQLLLQDLAHLLEQHGLSVKQYNVLRAVRRAGADGATAFEIQEQMYDRASDVTRLIDRLVRMELVSRKEDAQDRRVVRTLLTAKGVACLASLDEPVVALHKSQLGHLTPDDHAQLAVLLAKASTGRPAEPS